MPKLSVNSNNVLTGKRKMVWKALDIISEHRNRHDRIWFLYWRPQIESLMSGSPENYVAALMLIIPCMERTFTLKHPERDYYRSKKAGTKAKQIPIADVLKWYFRNENPEEFDQIMDIVAQGFANGLKHDSFVRDEICLLDENVAPVQSGNTGNAADSMMHIRRTQAISSMKDGRVAIAPRSFWYVVQHKIDNFYIEEYSRANDDNRHE